MSLLTKAGAVLAGVVVVGYLAGPDTGTARGTVCLVSGYGPDQLDNAATIVAVGRDMGIPERGRVVAVATALQESGLRNLNHGDRDSLGLFQQRPSMGWGSPVQIMSPSYSARKFYERLRSVPGWQQMSVTTAAQAVQRSGFPAAYARHENSARAIVDAVDSAGCAAS
ncbi:hypothetical protein KIPE111705_36895 [Kibdelosporangium persicum]|uniref:Peptidoglycan-binding protein LysM n=1 Tax=Kibdelosporangium persicum TaxID=2698649 RepID=A0ABX2F3N1_9PSEU|nr:hypothetical protein [Kibdelosporangium persicum]NRN65907.1 Peptidoglycan-binding protein LysM [Kibdelosporangium persicum]